VDWLADQDDPSAEHQLSDFPNTTWGNYYGEAYTDQELQPVVETLITAGDVASVGTVFERVVSVRSTRVIPAEERETPDALCHDGLWPHEILLLDREHWRDTQATQYEDWWWPRYGVKDPAQAMGSLADRGFLRPENLTEALHRETIPTLKALPEADGLPVGGKKAELLARLLDAVPIDQLDIQFPARRWVLTEQGQEAIDAEPQVALGDGGVFGLDIWTATELVHRNPGRPWRDVIWGVPQQDDDRPRGRLPGRARHPAQPSRFPDG